MKAKRAALYARVSTSQQEQEATIESQVAAVKDWVKQQGYELSEEHCYQDQAVSGARLDRPALDQLRDAAALGKFEVLVCLSSDRLARQFVHQRLLLDELQQLGIEVVFLNQPKMADSPDARLFQGIQGLFAEYERSVITDRLRRGKLYRERQGKLMRAGPYGYRYIDRTQPDGERWEIDPREGAVVQEIFEWYTEEGLSQAAIATRLAQRQIPARCGGNWHPYMIGVLLQQEAYTGTAHSNRTRSLPETIGQPKKSGHGRLKRARVTRRSPEEWIALEVPALVSCEQWQRAQEQRMENQRLAKRNNHRHAYLLRGLLVCGICGHTLVGEFGGGHRYYACRGGGKNRLPGTPPHTCRIAAQPVEERVWQGLITLLREPERIQTAWESLSSEPDPHSQPCQRLEKRLKQLDQQWNRLVDAYQEGWLEKEHLTTRHQAMERERQHLANQLAQAQQVAQQDLQQRELLKNFHSFADRIAASLDQASFETQREILCLLVDHILVQDETLLVQHVLPDLQFVRLSQRTEYDEFYEFSFF